MSYPLGLLTLGFTLGLIQLSHLPHLPNWLPVLTSTLWAVQLAVLLFSVCSVAVCHQFTCQCQHAPQRRLALGFVGFTGYAMGFATAGLAALNTQLHQVPLSCHGVEVEGEFMVEGLDFKPESQLLATLFTEHTETGQCIRQGTRLQVWIDQSNEWRPGQLI